jgi:cytochrome c-type biogenesis protein CcmH
VQGRVRLSPALAQQAAPTDTVFIFARAAEGPRMPLAILRSQVKDLPLAFTLDDSTAMSPAMRLSLHPKVVVSARISKSGQAVPAAGDLQGQSSPVANDARGVDVEIDEVVKN